MVYMNVHSNQKSDGTALLYTNSNFDWLKGGGVTDWPLYCTIKPSHFVPLLGVLSASLSYSSGMLTEDSDRWKQKLWWKIWSLGCETAPTVRYADWTERTKIPFKGSHFFPCLGRYVLYRSCFIPGGVWIYSFINVPADYMFPRNTLLHSSWAFCKPTLNPIKNIKLIQLGRIFGSRIKDKELWENERERERGGGDMKLAQNRMCMHPEANCVYFVGCTLPQ